MKNINKITISALLFVMAISSVGVASAHTGNLNKGSRGSEVAEAQSDLISKGYLKFPRGVAKGYFGKLSTEAVSRAQAALGLSVTGVYDFETELKLTGKNHGKQSEVVSKVPDTNTKAASLRVLLNSINREHANLASLSLRKGFDGAPDFEASFKALDNNSIEIANSITAVYGADAGAKFLEIWRSHISFFKNYTVASKTNEQVGKDKAVKDLAGYVNNISTFLSQANPNLPFDAVHSLVSTHVGLLKNTIDLYFAGDLNGSYSKQHETDVQIGTGVADAVAGAIVKQFPGKF